MRAHECHHCKQWIEEGEAHDCWTTTESALTADLSEDLKESWERLREEAADLGADSPSRRGGVADYGLAA